MLPVSAYLSGRDNNFKLLRLLAATLVILGHSFSVVRGPSAPAPPAPWLPFSFGGLAVDVFFTLSGFLITKSYLDRRDPWSFVRARVLRIYPAGILAILFTVFVVGLPFTTLDLRAYLSASDTWSYLMRNLPLIFSPIRSSLPGVFVTNPTPYGVNDPLWTLPYEMWMYGSVLVLGIVGMLASRRWMNVLLAASLAVYWAAATSGAEWIEGPSLGPLWRLAFFFAFGACAFLNRDWFPLSPAIAVAAIVAAALTFGRSAHLPVLSVTLAYVTLVLAFVPAGVIRRYNSVGDYSYGLYVFGFPIQQTIAALWPGLGVAPIFGLSMAASLAVAAGSWHFVEAPALRLKSGSQ